MKYIFYNLGRRFAWASPERIARLTLAQYYIYSDLMAGEMEAEAKRYG